MHPNSVILTIGSRSFTVIEIVFAAGILGLVLLTFLAILVWRSSRARKADAIEHARRAYELDQQIAELNGALQTFALQTQNQQQNMERTLDERLDMVSQRLGHGLSEQTEKTSTSLSALNERLAVIDTAQQNLTRLSGEMVNLKDILANKQTRGAFGQGRMEAIIRDGLHTKAYMFQATLSNGTRPDCVISLPDSALKLVIDAKFPLEAYNALREVRDDHQRGVLASRFRQDIMRHVKDIAEKYLLPGETHETAIMFVPSESVYAELHEQYEDVVQKAHRSQVIFASPNVLLLLVQTMQTIIKDVAMSEQAHVIQGEVVKLLEDVSRLRERTGDLKRHFEQAGIDIDKIIVSADRIAKRGMRIESLDLAETEKAGTLDAPRPRLVNSN